VGGVASAKATDHRADSDSLYFISELIFLDFKMASIAKSIDFKYT